MHGTGVRPLPVTALEHPVDVPDAQRIGERQRVEDNAQQFLGRHAFRPAISRIGAPITVPSPQSGRISPSSALIVVVLPAPLRPT